MELLKKYCNYIGIGGAILLLLGNFFEFCSINYSILGVSQREAVKFIDGDGIFVAVAAVVAFFLVYSRKGKWNLIPSCISAAIILYDISNVKDNMSTIASLANAETSYGLGFWVLLIGVAAVIMYSLLYNENDSTILPVFKKDTNHSTNLQAEHVKYCGECGSPNEMNTKFCTNCGKKL